MSEIRPNYYVVNVQARVLNGGDGDKQTVEIECFDLIDALCGGDLYLGNAIKYLFRAGRKTEDRKEDLIKTITYCQQRIDRDQNGG